MDFRRVEAALEKIGLRDQYIRDFRENGLHDAAINFEDGDIVSALSEIIPNHADRVKFRKAFKDLTVANLDDTKNETPGGHFVKSPSVTPSQNDGPDRKRLKVTHSQDRNQTPPHHENDVNITGIKVDGDGTFGDATTNTLLNLARVTNLNIQDYSGLLTKKLKLELKDRIEFNTFDPIESFTGREEVLEKLHVEIQESKKEGEIMTVLSQANVISGIGGVGKTQTIRKYIQRYKLQYEHIIWINSQDEGTMRSCFLKLAESVLGMSCKNREDQYDSDEDIKNRVYEILCEKHCLIVFDNAESLDKEHGIRKFLPPTVHSSWQTPTIIVTSRSRAWKGRVIQLQGLTEDEIWQFFSEQLKLEDTGENRGLSKKIGDLCEGLPLVLQQVLALIIKEHEAISTLDGQRSYTMSDFLSAYDEGQKKYLKHRDEDCPFSDSVYIIFSMTFEILSKKNNGPLALRCITMMSFLSPSCIPKPLFVSLSESGIDYTQSIILLKNYNLINVCGHHFEIHRTIQEVTVELLKDSSIFDFRSIPGITHGVLSGSPACVDEILVYIMEHLDVYLPKLEPNDVHKHACFQNAFRVASHAKHMFTVNGLPKFVFNLIQRAMDIYYNETYALLYTIRTQLSAEMDKNDAATCSIIQQVLFRIKIMQANALHRMSKYDEALQLHKETISSLEDEHESEILLVVKSNMAMTLEKLGQYGEAQELLEDLIHKKLQVEDIEAVRDLRKNLSTVLIKRSRYEEALGILKPLVQEQEAAGCSWNLSNLSTHHNLAMALMHMDKHNEALDLLQKVILQQEQLLGNYHPTTLLSKSNQITCLLGMKNFQEGLTLCQKLTNEVANALDEDNEFVLSQKLHMATALEGLGRYKDALAVAEEASTKWKRHGESQPGYLRMERMIAALEQDMGRHERALSRLDYVIDTCKQTVGPDHHMTLASINDKAVVLVNLGEFSDAEEILREVLETKKKVLGLTHSSTLATTENLSVVLFKQEKYRDALALANEVVIAMEEMHGLDHLDTLSAKDTRATILYALGNHREALSIYQNFLPKLLEVAGNCKTEEAVLNVRVNLAGALHNTGNIAESISLFEEIINDCSEAGELDPRCMILAMKELRSILQQTGRYNESLSLFEKAASRVESVFGALDPRSIESKLSLAEVMMIVDPSRGVTLYAEIVSACETYYGKHDRNKTEEAMRALAASFVSVGSISSIDACLSILEEKLFQGEDVGLNKEIYWMLKMKIDTAIALVKLGRNKMAYEICMPFLTELEVSNGQTSQGNHTVLELCKCAQLSRAKILCGNIIMNEQETFQLHRQL